MRGKNRAYRERDIGIILLIKRLLHHDRYSTRGARQKLKNEPELVRSAGESGTEFRHGGGGMGTSPTLQASAGLPPAGAPDKAISDPGGGRNRQTDRRQLFQFLSELRTELESLLKFLS